MAEAFEFRELRDAVFWGVDLRGATFRDVDLTGTRISHARVVDVDIDALVDRVVINGVDVTAYVNERDPWYPLRAALLSTDPGGMRAGWRAVEAAWAAAYDRARALTEAQRHESVGGEWSFVETLRHLVFATDKWFTVPIAGGAFHPIGLPNTGSRDFGWPGLDLGADPTFDEALAVRADRAAAFGAYLDALTPDELLRVVEILENGPNPVQDCILCVLEEEFQHLRYALRDLDHLA
jgi:hypothetical protein